MTWLLVPVAFVVGMNLWYLAEYLLHRFAMHELKGKGMMSSQHLTHHVTAGWFFDYHHVLSWVGVGLVGGAVWFPLGWWLAGPWVGLALSLGGLRVVRVDARHVPPAGAEEPVPAVGASPPLPPPLRTPDVEPGRHRRLVGPPVRDL